MAGKGLNPFDEGATECVYICAIRKNCVPLIPEGQ